LKTTVYIGTSLDGFIARKDDDIEWLVKFQNTEIHQSYKEFLDRIDAIVIGRGTYEKVLTYPSWPYEKKVFVLSNSIKIVPAGLKEKLTILSMRPKELLDYLSGKGFHNIYVDGGKVIQDFLKEDCIDEMIITKVPELIGSGIPLFGHLEKDIQFVHLQTEVYSNGLVKSRYERKRK
jgi:dihydrofolate reductase